MKCVKLSSWALVVALGLVGCQLPPEEEVTASPAEDWYNCLTREVFTPEKQAWCDRLMALQNAEYTFPEVGTVQLTNGEYDSETDETSVTFVNEPGLIATGTLSDGTPITATILGLDQGGSGIFVYLAAMAATEDTYTNLDTVLLGDRVQVRSVRVDGGLIKVNLITQGPDDPMCCPTLEVERTYALENGTLQLVTEEELSVIPYDPGREAYAEMELPSNIDLVGNDPVQMAQAAFGAQEPVEGNYQEDAVLIERTLGGPVVFFTQTGLADDSVEGIRYRIEYVREGDQVRMVWVGRQVRCYEGRGSQDWSTDICQ